MVTRYGWQVTVDVFFPVLLHRLSVQLHVFVVCKIDVCSKVGNDGCSCVVQLVELNSFFLKHIFVVGPSHPLCIGRLLLIAVISAPSIRYAWHLLFASCLRSSCKCCRCCSIVVWRAYSLWNVLHASLKVTPKNKAGFLGHSDSKR